jgi:serine/threonine protein kinase
MQDAFEQLRAIVATRTQRLVLWTGAGLSAPAGIPTWNVLQRRLEARLEEKLKELDVPDAQRDAKLKSVRQEQNPWVAFQRLQSDLGLTTYRETIRAALAKAASADVPPAYDAAWKLRPAGLVNLNLDRLATRAFAESALTGLIEFKGKDIGGHAHTLNSPRPFICNLHGVEDDYDSWVFTAESLKALAGVAAYETYLSALLATTTVLFLGITIDDVAVGGHLERLAKFGMQTHPHYWITDRRDPASDAWAERNNVRVIRYKPSAADHRELVEMLTDLARSVQPEEGPSPPVALPLQLTNVAIESVADISRKDPEQIRIELNAYASTLLQSDDANRFAQYEEFSQSYDRAIHTAWYTSVVPPDNEFLGYKLVDEAARGAFGIVFKAVDKDGREVAVKLLHAEIRRKSELLDAFRRGARSLGILERHGVAGVVRFVEASEIPATLIMEWVDGPNLNDVVSSGSLTEWEPILDIATQLSAVIASAHALPERVLHRDIRPPNMIVSGYWEGEPLALTVLDFDLSWHRGSVEKSVIFGSQLSGYLAPEQIQRKAGVSTQHASVDSYGIGMTLFYMVAGRDPKPGEHAYGSWPESVKSAVRRPRGDEWKSIPNRIARLILAATREAQEERWDVIQLRSELTRLFEAQRDQSLVQSAELIAEELAARTSMMVPYQWDTDTYAIVKDFGTGLTVMLRGNETSREVELRIRRISGEADNRNRLGDAITRARDLVRAALKDAGWSAHAEAGHGLLTVEASIAAEEILADFAGAADALRRAIEKTQFQ